MSRLELLVNFKVKTHPCCLLACSVVVKLWLAFFNSTLLNSVFVISEFLLSNLSLLGWLFGRMAYMRMNSKLVNE